MELHRVLKDPSGSTDDSDRHSCDSTQFCGIYHVKLCA